MALKRHGWAEMRREAAQLATATNYAILGIERSAPLATIRKAYYRLSKQWHPDKHSGQGKDAQARAISMFGRVSHAYEILSNPAARAAYDASIGPEVETRRKTRSGQHTARSGEETARTQASRGGGREKCDQQWFERAMREPDINIHDHCTEFDDGEFDDYLRFMKKWTT